MNRQNINNYIGAIEDYSVYIRYYPNSYDTYFLRSHAFSAIGRKKDAISDLNESAEICLAIGNTEGYKRAHSFLNVYDTNDLQNNPAEELKSEISFEAASTENDLSALELYDLAQEEIKQDNTEKAIEYLTSALSINTEFVSAYILRCKQYFNLHNYQAVIEDCNKIIKLSPDEYDAYEYRGRCFGLMERHSEAIKDLNKLIELRPNYSDAYFYRGITFQNSNELQLALKDYTQAIENDPASFQYYYSRGIINGQIKKYSEAIQDFTQTIELEPNCNGVYYRRGLSYYFINNYSEAIKDFIKATKINKDDYNSYYSIAECYKELEDYYEAEEYYTQAILANPKLIDAYWKRGYTRTHELKEFQLAITDDWDVLIKFNQQDAESYLQRGLCHTLIETEDSRRQGKQDLLTAINIFQNQGDSEGAGRAYKVFEGFYGY